LSVQGLRRLLVATDFSARSDRALRRAELLARQTGAALTLVHAVDDDRGAAMAAGGARDAAERLLDQLARTLSGVDGLDAETRLAPAPPGAGIAAVAAEIGADLIVVGAPRQPRLRGAFAGTTLDRIVRAAECPILLACGVPGGFYGHVLVATDLEAHSVAVARAAADLGLDRLCAVTAAHVFDATLPPLRAGEESIREQAENWIETQHRQAEARLSASLEPSALAVTHRLVRLNRSTVAATLLDVAREVAADLLVVGSRGSRGPGGRLPGGVTYGLLRNGTIDVLVVPISDPATTA